MKVLVVEDSPNYQTIYREEAPSNVTLFPAYTFDEALDLIAEHGSSLDLVVLDGQLTPGGGLETHLLFTFLEVAGFHGRAVAASSYHKYQDIIVQQGECYPNLSSVGRVNKSNRDEIKALFTA
jgi:response regulator of citrate/malate metabolism